MAHFPMFVDLTGKPCLIAGGGRVALRKAGVLLDFGAAVTVIAPEVCDELAALAVSVEKRCFRDEDCVGSMLVVAATDDRTVNHRIAAVCREQGIPVNVIDSREESTFLFPAYQKTGNVVAAFSGSGNSPLIAQKLKEQTQLPPILGELNDLLGCLRTDEQVKADSRRKQLYQKLYDTAMERGKVPDWAEIQEWIHFGL